MKYPIINEIVNGSNGAAERRTVNYDNANTKKLSDLHEKLLGMLTPEQREVFDKFIAAWEDLYLDDSDANCVEAFRLGLRVGREGMTD